MRSLQHSRSHTSASVHRMLESRFASLRIAWFPFRMSSLSWTWFWLLTVCEQNSNREKCPAGSWIGEVLFYPSSGLIFDPVSFFFCWGSSTRLSFDPIEVPRKMRALFEIFGLIRDFGFRMLRTLCQLRLSGIISHLHGPHSYHSVAWTPSLRRVLVFQECCSLLFVWNYLYKTVGLLKV